MSAHSFRRFVVQFADREPISAISYLLGGLGLGLALARPSQDERAAHGAVVSPNITNNNTRYTWTAGGQVVSESTEVE
jgi:hypothetical protein